MLKKKLKYLKQCTFFLFLISQEQNDIKKNRVQLSWNTTLICCKLLIYILLKKKERKNYIKLGDTKLDPVNNPNGQK